MDGYYNHNNEKQYWNSFYASISRHFSYFFFFFSPFLFFYQEVKQIFLTLDIPLD